MFTERKGEREGERERERSEQTEARSLKRMPFVHWKLAFRFIYLNDNPRPISQFSRDNGRIEAKCLENFRGNPLYMRVDTRKIIFACLLVYPVTLGQWGVSAGASYINIANNHGPVSEAEKYHPGGNRFHYLFNRGYLHIYV